MSIVIRPSGTNFCDWSLRVPSQTDANTYLNVDEGVPSADTSDYVGSNALSKQWNLVFPRNLSKTGLIPWIVVSYSINATSIDSIAALSFQITLAGVAKTTAKLVVVDTLGTNLKRQIMWSGNQIYGLTYEQWEAEPNFRILVVRTFDGDDVPGGTKDSPYVPVI